MECKIERNRKICTCSYEGCERNGICCDCIAYHRKRRELPACYFTPEVEATYDRSIERFIAMYQKKG
ncbi:MAG TPA: DUF6485 family protein [Thermodesulfovibrio thiophilus]|uniref:DUF6485 family protein n=1 Tax=Thermodesulfovibrio thiophilus TaxID=340095 RepID=UPI000406D4FF|nr:DUF6485 family protein [Thermodesulfovibrio thiophilus]HOA82959.1 DUF6485 family protein [Thermodesulfovibrio thiophilus]HQA03706.1 DUF6485 family protein [Thermodesulfovibrio thiophilus]HQD35649.1 DUF6485 family protein [Thermodesulfovibrio thiophilus]